MKEYGTNTQKLVDYILTVEERERRTKYAYLLVELMRQVHPNMRDNQDYSNKLWDDLYIMSNFKLDVDSPFPPPSPDAVGKRPKGVPYNVNRLAYKHYGKNIELLIKRTVNTTDMNDRKILISYIGKLMKTFYTTWNKEVVDDAVIWGHFKEMAGGMLDKAIDEIAGGSNLGFSNRNRNNNSNERRTSSNDRNDRRGGSSNDRNDRRGGGSNDRNDRNNNDRRGGGGMDSRGGSNDRNRRK
jgi:hypothetical protein